MIPIIPIIVAGTPLAVLVRFLIKRQNQRRRDFKEFKEEMERKKQENEK